MKKLLFFYGLSILLPWLVVAQWVGDISDKQSETLSYEQQKWALLQEVYANPDYVSLIDIEKATITMEDLSKSFKKIELEYDQYNAERSHIEEKYGNVQQQINTICITFIMIITDDEVLVMMYHYLLNQIILLRVFQQTILY